MITKGFRVFVSQNYLKLKEVLTQLLHLWSGRWILPSLNRSLEIQTGTQLYFLITQKEKLSNLLSHFRNSHWIFMCILFRSLEIMAAVPTILSLFVSLSLENIFFFFFVSNIVKLFPHAVLRWSYSLCWCKYM